MCYSSRCAEPYQGHKPWAQRAARGQPKTPSGTSWQRRVKAPSTGAGSPKASAGGGLGALAGRVGPGRTPDPPAAVARCTREGARAEWGGARCLRPAAPACRQRSQLGAGAMGGGGNGARGRGAAVSRYRPQRPLTLAPPRSPRAVRAPPIGALAPPALGWVCARGQWDARGGWAASEGGAARGPPIEAVLLKLKILFYANRGGARGPGGWDPRV